MFTFADLARTARLQTGTRSFQLAQNQDVHKTRCARPRLGMTCQSPPAAKQRAGGIPTSVVRADGLMLAGDNRVRRGLPSTASSICPPYGDQFSTRGCLNIFGQRTPLGPLVSSQAKENPRCRVSPASVFDDCTLPFRNERSDSVWVRLLDNLATRLLNCFPSRAQRDLQNFARLLTGHD